LKPNIGGLRSAGKAARARAISRAGHSRPSKLDWYPEIAAFQDRGWKVTWIAEALAMDESHIRKILAAGRQHTVDIASLPIEVDTPGPYMERTPEGFERFFVEFSGEGYLPDHAKDWVRLALTNPRQVINTPPDHAKTTIMSIWFVSWLLCTDRNTRVMLMSQTKDLVSTWGWSIHSVLTDEEVVRRYGRFTSEKMGDVVWQPGQGRLMVLGRTMKGKPGDLSLYCRGMDQQIMGIRADWIICDDIVSPETYESPEKARKVMLKFNASIATRTNPEGHIIVIGQRVNPEDLYQDLSERIYETGPLTGENQWKVDIQPMVVNWEKQLVLWPGRHSWEDVELHRGDAGSVLFECMYQQNPRPPEARMVQPEWIEACKDRDRFLGQGVREKNKQSIVPAARVISVDPSPKNWNVLIVADVVRTKGNWACMLVDIERWKGGSVEFERKVGAAVKRYRPDYLIVEESSFMSWIDESLFKENLPAFVTLIHHHTGVNKGSIELGADTVAVDYEMKRISIPWGDPETQKAFEILIKEALEWPNGRTFDSWMATWFIKWQSKRLRAKGAWVQPPLDRSKLNASGRMKYDEMMRQGKLPNYARSG
jgi:hypothetical protein